MKYKLIEVIRKAEEDVEFGSCDLCKTIATHYFDVLVFEDEEGYLYKAENGFWSWGDYIISWHIDNYVKFADFISDKDYPKVELDQYRDSNIEEIVGFMYSDFEEEEEDL